MAFEEAPEGRAAPRSERLWPGLACRLPRAESGRGFHVDALRRWQWCRSAEERR